MTGEFVIVLQPTSGDNRHGVCPKSDDSCRSTYRARGRARGGPRGRAGV
eukprot:COSAG02_NODE_30257_length_554_cov_1.589011_1_plen_48_part_10